MLRGPPISTRTDTLFPYTTLFRSAGRGCSTDSEPPAVSVPRIYRTDAGMDGKPISGPQGRYKGRKRKAKRRPRGLEIVERDGFWHIHGTVKIAGRSVRVRRSSGIPARNDTFAAADEERDRIKRQIHAEVIEGRSVGVPVSVAARNYLKRSEEHTSELQSLMRISYAVFCLKKKNTHYKIYQRK